MRRQPSSLNLEFYHNLGLFKDPPSLLGRNRTLIDASTINFGRKFNVVAGFSEWQYLSTCRTSTPSGARPEQAGSGDQRSRLDAHTPLSATPALWLIRRPICIWTCIHVTAPGSAVVPCVCALGRVKFNACDIKCHLKTTSVRIGGVRTFFTSTT